MIYEKVVTHSRMHFANFLGSSVPASLADDLHRLEMAQTDDSSDTDTVNEVSNINSWYTF